MSQTIAKPRVAFQGERGAFSEEAALKLLSDQIELVPCQTFEALFASFDDNGADYVLAPVENSAAGAVIRVHELMQSYPCSSHGEVIISIHQHLIGCPGARFEEITRVESHPVALAQCRRFLAAHPRIEAVAADDTAGSVAEVIRCGDRSRAAIASRRAAELYGGVILRERIEDDPDNQTRFVLLARKKTPMTEEGAEGK